MDPDQGAKKEGNRQKCIIVFQASEQRLYSCKVKRSLLNGDIISHRHVVREGAHDNEGLELQCFLCAVTNRNDLMRVT